MLEFQKKVARFAHGPGPYFLKARRIIISVFVNLFDWDLIYIYYARYLLVPMVARRVKRKQRLRVVYLPMAIPFWKYGALCDKMQGDSRFEVVIMPVMRTNQSFEEQIRDQSEMIAYFRGKGCSVVPSYDAGEGRWNRLEDLKPDIIFYTQPYSGIGRIRPQYDYFAQRHSLICFSPYGFGNTKTKYMYDNVLQNVAWRVYAPVATHAKWACEMMRNHGYNVRVSGYYFEDEYRHVTEEDAKKAWSKDAHVRKHVIWAPHHSFPKNDTIGLSTFMETHQIMRELAIRYKDKIFFAFKPHPVLRSKLLLVWSKEQVDEYYSFWDSQENTMFADGTYLDLFKGSDALIHDCDSFLIEYLYTQKPVMFLVRENSPWKRRELGIAATACHYKALTEADIIQFIDDVVLRGKDNLVSARKDFYISYLQSSKVFSDYIMADIVDSLRISNK